jgi:hypothetical protein
LLSEGEWKVEKNVAKLICKHIEDFMKNNQTTYDIAKVDFTGGSIQGFHQWTNGKPLIAGYHVSIPEEKSYYLLFIDWHRNQNYYLVIYPFDKSTTLAELQTINELDGKEVITWKYNPLKRDGKNQQRKSYFKQIFGTTIVNITIPTSYHEVSHFFDQLFSLCQKRQKADRIVDVFES